MRRKSHVRFGVGEKAEITSKPYLSLQKGLLKPLLYFLKGGEIVEKRKANFRVEN